MFVFDDFLPKNSAYVPFVKMQSLGNDIMIVHPANNFSSELAQALCHRRFGVGADQIMEYTYPFRIWNKDGSEATTCGNGIRCLLAFQRHYNHTLIPLSQGFHHHDGMISVYQGKPQIGVLNGNVYDIFSFIHEGKTFEAIPVDVGNPHLVIKAPLIFLKEIGKKFNASIVGGVNVSLVDGRHMATWERGAGPTLGCGSGACAVAAVLFAEDPKCTHVNLSMPGGTILVQKHNIGLVHTASTQTVHYGYWLKSSAV